MTEEKETKKPAVKKPVVHHKEEKPKRKIAEKKVVKEKELPPQEKPEFLEEIPSDDFPTEMAGPETKLKKYYEGTGRRKTAIARVRLFTKGDRIFSINGKPFDVYFQTIELQQLASSSLNKMKCLERFQVLAQVRGGGLHAQAEAIRHGAARALTQFNPDFRKRLRRAGFLTRDARMRERKKFGLKRARRAPQWAKR